MSTVFYAFIAYSSTLSFKSNHHTTMNKELDMMRNVMAVDTKTYKLQILFLGCKVIHTVGYATTNGCYNERMLQRTDATTNSFYQ